MQAREERGPAVELGEAAGQVRALEAGYPEDPPGVTEVEAAAAYPVCRLTMRECVPELALRLSPEHAAEPEMCHRVTVAVGDPEQGVCRTTVLDAVLRCPPQGAELEELVPVDRALELVGDRVAKRTTFPALCCPLVADSAVNLVRPGRRRPVDRAVLEMVVA